MGHVILHGMGWDVARLVEGKICGPVSRSTQRKRYNMLAHITNLEVELTVRRRVRSVVASGVYWYSTGRR